MKVAVDPWYNTTMETTDPQANAQLVACHSSEMQGERIVKVEYGHPAHRQSSLDGGARRNPYASLVYTMASGKVFVVTASMGEVNCYRSSVDAEAATEPPRDPKREASWVIRLGTKNGAPVYLGHPSHNIRTQDLDEAHGWHYKKDARAEAESYFTCSASSLGLDPPNDPARGPKVDRRSAFRK